MAVVTPIEISRLKIISGGQTGVDRAALDAALKANASCGGWCPAGRKAEDGPIAAHYPLQELPGARYIQRTHKNVEDSDATLIITFGPPTGGTARTIEFCHKLGKRHLIVDAELMSADEATRLVLELVKGRGVRRLNVAGPRASGEPRAYDYAYGVVKHVLSALE